MAATNTDDVVWVDVLPSLAGFNPALRAGLVGSTGEATTAGARAGAAFGAGFGDAAVKAAESAALKVSAAQKKVADSTGQLSVAQAKLTELMDSGNASAARMAAAEESVAKAQRNVQLATEQLTVAQTQQERAAATAATATRAAADETAAATVRMNEGSLASRAFSGTFALFRGAAAQVGELGKSFAPFIVGGAIYEAVKGASSFNAAMLRIQTQAGATSQEIAKFKPAILSMASEEVTQSPEDLATSLYHVYSTGLKGAEALDVVRSSAKFATIANADLEETTNALTSTVASGIGGFHGMDQAVAALNTTVGAGDMKLSDLNEALGSGVLARVKLFGVNIQDVGAALATFGDNNVRGADAATMLRTAVEALAVPARGGQKTLDALGLSAGRLAKDMQEGGLNKAITDLHDHLIKAGISADQTGAIITQAFGKKAGGGVALLLGQYDRLESKYDAIRAAQDNFQAQWDATTKTASFAFASLGSTLEVLSIRIGNALLPILSRAATGFGSFLNQLMDGSGQAGQLMQAFRDLGSVLGTVWQQIQGPVKLAFSALGTVVGTLVGWFADLASWVKQHQTLVESLAIAVGILTAAYKLQVAIMAAQGLAALISNMRIVVAVTNLWRTAQAALDIVLAANPIGIVVVALAALAAAIAFAWTHSQTFRDIVLAVWDVLEGAVLTAVHAIEAAWGAVIYGLLTAWMAVSGALTSAWNTTWGALSGAYHAVVDGLTAAWNAVVYGFVTAWDAVSGALTAAWSAFWAGLMVVIGPVVAGMKAAWDGIVVAWNVVAAAISWAWTNVIQPVWSVMEEVGKVLAVILGVAILGPVALAWEGIQYAIQGAWFVIQAVWSAMQAAWSAIWGGMQVVYNTVILPVWNGIVAAAQWMWNSVLLPIWTGLQIEWAAVWGAMQAVYNTVILPVWNALQAAAVWMWTNVLAPTWAAIQAAWNALGAAFQWVWVTIIQPCWNAVAAATEWLHQTLVAIWNALSGATQAIWNALVGWLNLLWTNFRNNIVAIATDVWNVLVAIWNALSGATSAIWNALVGWVTGLWTSFRNTVVGTANDVWNTLVNVFTVMRDAVVRTWNDVVGGIEGAWNRLKGIAEEPIKFVIGTVLNNGLFAAWNWISDHILGGALKVQPIHVLGLAEGGEIPGPWMGPKADNVPAFVPTANGAMPIRVNPREWIQPVDSVDYYGAGLMAAIQTKRIDREALDLAMALTGGYADGGQVPGFAGGGQTWPQLWGIVHGAFPNAVMTSNYRPGANDYHGLGEAIDVSFGGNPQSLLMPLAAWIAQHYPGSTELIHNPNGSIKNGRVVPPSFWGAATWAQHANHVHWAMTPAALAGGGGLLDWLGHVWNTATDVLGSLTSSITGPIHDLLARFGDDPFTELITKVPGAAITHMWDAVKDKITGFFASIFETSYGVSTTGPVQDQVKSAFRAFHPGWETGSEWSSTDYIVRNESGWNPKAKNPHSSASGLFQLIDATWRAYRGPNDTKWARAMDAPPGVQAEAGANYIGSKYGDPNAAATYWRAHHNYFAGGPVPTVLDTGGLWPPGLGLNLTDGFERVLTAPQDNMTQRLIDATTAIDAGALGDHRSYHFDVYGGPDAEDIARAISDEQRTVEFLHG